MSGTPLPFGRSHLEALREPLARLDADVDRLGNWGRRLAEVLLGGGRLLAVGNGGSAAQAQHLTSELVGRYRDDRPPFSAIALHAESSSLTAICNDYGPAEGFARQVGAHGRPGDVLVALSTSGRSENVLAAVEAAHGCGLTVWGLTGTAPNPLQEACDDALSVDAPTATVQEVHQIAIHLLCAAFEVEVSARLDAAARATRGGPPDGTARTASQGGRAPAADPARRRPRRRGDRPVVVIGDALLDCDLDGRVERLCPDAPAPVVDAPTRSARPGGAALAGALAAASGHEVVLVTAVADDAPGRELVSLLDRAGVQVVNLGLRGATPEKVRVRTDSRTLLRIDHGGPPSAVGSLTGDARRALEAAAAVLVSDYGRGMTAEGSVREVLSNLRVPIVWDPHPRGAEPTPGVRLATPNGAEAAGFAPEVTGDGLPAVAARARAIGRRWQAAGVAVTLGAGGAVLVEGDGLPLVVPAEPVPGGDPCGAGDRFAATAAIRLAGGALPSEAVGDAVRDAAAFVAAGGTSAAFAGSAPGDRGRTPGGEVDVRDVTTPQTGRAGGDGLAGGLGDLPDGGLAAAQQLVARVRSRGGTVVATGGCFDLLHAGHVHTLAAARSLGDCLIVCLNSDRSVRRLKGADRPVVGEADRASVLSALGAVDAVVLFDEDTPEAVLDRLRPDIFAKGGDYGLDALPEAPLVAAWGGQAVILPYVEGRSTTRMLEEAIRRGTR